MRSISLSNCMTFPCFILNPLHVPFKPFSLSKLLLVYSCKVCQPYRASTAEQEQFDYLQARIANCHRRCHS